jgi:hypothetical protein
VNAAQVEELILEKQAEISEGMSLMPTGMKFLNLCQNNKIS